VIARFATVILTALALAVSPLAAASVQMSCGSTSISMTEPSYAHASTKTTDPCCDHGSNGCAQFCADAAAAALPVIAVRFAAMVVAGRSIVSPSPRAPAIAFTPGLLDPPPKLHA
jgi:hypothetical protein